jgi:DNA-binding MarR family transcriptional regulator
LTDRGDYSREARGAALGARLRRLSERLDRESTRVYSALGVRFEQRWFGLLDQIMLNGPMTVGEVAASLRVTHVSVSQARCSLEAAGLVQSLNDAKDARRRLIALTPRGQTLVGELTPLWQALGDSARELNAEAGDVVALLDRLDEALDTRSLFDRVMGLIEPPNAPSAHSQTDL